MDKRWQYIFFVAKSKIGYFWGGVAVAIFSYHLKLRRVMTLHFKYLSQIILYRLTIQVSNVISIKCPEFIRSGAKRFEEF